MTLKKGKFFCWHDFEVILKKSNFYGESKLHECKKCEKQKFSSIGWPELGAEAKTTYTHKKERWHELPGETAVKDKRLEMTSDNFYRIIAMSEEIIEEQRIEIGKMHMQLKKFQNKLSKQGKKNEDN